MPFYDLVCPNGHKHFDMFLRLNDARPACPECSGSLDTLWEGKRAGIQDNIEGGLWIEHGICNSDGSPKKYYTKSAIYKAAKAKGLHVGAFVHGSPPGRTWV